MNALDFLYQNPPPRAEFVPRKAAIERKKTWLKGAGGVGKTSLALDFLFKFERFLYIDLADLRFASFDFLDGLDEFVAQNHIEALCIDSAPRGFSRDFKCENIVIASRFENANLKDYSNLTLRGLDFEEFIAFYPRGASESAAFSHFLALGNAPRSALSASAEGLKTSLRAEFEPLELKILSKIARQISQPLSALAIFRELKESEKLSKDRFYETLARLEETGALGYALAASGGRTRRAYFGDFALKSLLCAEKEPRQVIANMVFCELKKMDESPVFTDFADFALRGRGLAALVAPFGDPRLLALRVKKRARDFLDFGITRVVAVSNAGEASEAHAGLKIAVMPFWRWASGI